MIMTKRSTLLLIAAALALLLGLLYLPACAASPDNVFTFTNSGVTAAGAGTSYEIAGTALTIKGPGTYSLKGACANGSVTVEKEAANVTLHLDGLTLTAADTAPILCSKGSEVAVQVTGANTLRDGEDPADEDSADPAVADAFEGAAIKVKSGASLTLTGTGTLNIDAASCKNGIKGGAQSAITVDGPTLNIDAANTALASDGQLTVKSGFLDIDAGNEGLKADPDADDTASAGTIDISGGSFHITAADDAIHAAGDLTITAGTFTISAGDDAIHSDAALTIGAPSAAAGPEITVTQCVEGFEGARVDLHSGKGSVTSSDDGVNAANSDLKNYDFLINITGGSWNVDAGGDGLDSNGAITISGGVTQVCGAENGAGGDTAVDSETGCTITAGTLFTIDTNGTTPAGTTVRFGSADGGMGGGRPGGRPDSAQGGMPDAMPSGRPDGAQGGMPDAMPGGRTDGAQGGMPDAMPGGRPDGMPGGAPGQTSGAVLVSKGGTVEVKDSAGRTVYSTTAAKSGSTVVLAGDKLTDGQEYTLYVDGSAAGTAAASVTTGGGQRPGGNAPGEQPGGAAQTFHDVSPTDWYFDAVRYMQKTGLMSGTPGGAFSPDVTMTRGMIAAILYRLAREPAVTGGASFQDVDVGRYYTQAVAWASANGIAGGYGNGNFGPDDAITREQLAAVLCRYARYIGRDVSGQGELSGFKDADQVSAYARDALGWACAQGLITGDDNGWLLPQSGASRAQAAVILTRFCQSGELKL